MDYKMLFTPMNIGTCTIKNRVVLAPMLVGMGELDGKATPQLMDYYEERAKGGTGLIITEITRINDRTGSAAFAQLGMSQGYQIAPMKELADRIHSHGSKLFVQLHHPGRQNVGLLVGTVPMCIDIQKIWKGFTNTLYKIAPTIGRKMIANNIVLRSVCPSKADPAYFAGGRIRALRHGEIKKLVQQFIDGAERVQKAGCDGVMLHASHGYLIQQFLSPVTNFRTDEYGGSLENRMRFITEIIAGIRERCGKDFPLIVRLTVDECYDRIGMPGKGYGLDEGVEIAKRLEQAGVDGIDVSTAGYDTFNYWLEPISFEPGWRAYMAKAVKEAVSIPVIAANLIRSPEQAERQLEEGYQDFVSMGRPHIADPYWVEKVSSGREKEVKRCICCLYCIESMQENAYVGGHAECSVNPCVGRERATAELNKNGDGRVVVIVGAGPAGLMAAETLGKRGFKPIVLEKNAEAGGQLQLANKPPKKDKINWCIEDLVYAAELNGAEIKYNTTATPEVVAGYEPYAVIVATGGVAVRPKSIEGSMLDNVCTVTEVLNGNVKLSGKKVAVIGSGMTGMETAEMLTEQGNELIIIEMADKVAPGAWMQHKDDIMPKLAAHNVGIYTGEKLLKIEEDGITTENVKTKKQTKFPVENVVLSLGVRPVNNLAEELKPVCDKVFTVGDASKVGRIHDATTAAFNLAIELN